MVLVVTVCCQTEYISIALGRHSDQSDSHAAGRFAEVGFGVAEL